MGAVAAVGTEAGVAGAAGGGGSEGVDETGGAVSPGFFTKGQLTILPMGTNTISSGFLTSVSSLKNPAEKQKEFNDQKYQITGVPRTHFLIRIGSLDLVLIVFIKPLHFSSRGGRKSSSKTRPFEFLGRFRCPGPRNVKLVFRTFQGIDSDCDSAISCNSK